MAGVRLRTPARPDPGSEDGPQPPDIHCALDSRAILPSVAHVPKSLTVDCTPQRPRGGSPPRPSRPANRDDILDPLVFRTLSLPQRGEGFSGSLPPLWGRVGVGGGFRPRSTLIESTNSRLYQRNRGVLGPGPLGATGSVFGPRARGPSPCDARGPSTEPVAPGIRSFGRPGQPGKVATVYEFSRFLNPAPAPPPWRPDPRDCPPSPDRTLADRGPRRRGALRSRPCPGRRGGPAQALADGQRRHAAKKVDRVYHFGSQGHGGVFSNHTSHSNRLIPVYTFGRKVDLGVGHGQEQRLPRPREAQEALRLPPREHRQPRGRVRRPERPLQGPARRRGEGGEAPVHRLVRRPGLADHPGRRGRQGG